MKVLGKVMRSAKERQRITVVSGRPIEAFAPPAPVVKAEPAKAAPTKEAEAVARVFGGGMRPVHSSLLGGKK